MAGLELEFEHFFLKKMFKKFAVQGDNIITGGHFPLPPMFPGCLMGMARFFAEPFFLEFQFLCPVYKARKLGCL